MVRIDLDEVDDSYVLYSLGSREDTVSHVCSESTIHVISVFLYCWMHLIMYYKVGVDFYLPGQPLWIVFHPEAPSTFSQVVPSQRLTLLFQRAIGL